MPAVTELLMRRSNTERRIGELNTEITAKATVDERDTDALTYNLEDLIGNIMSMMDQSRVAHLDIQRINRTLTLEFEGNELTINEALSLRELFKRKAEFLRRLATRIAGSAGRKTVSTGYGEPPLNVVIIALSNPEALNTRAQLFENRRHELDIAIQKTNWVEI